MTASDGVALSPPIMVDSEDVGPSDLRVGLISAASVVLGIAVLSVGLLAMLTVSVWAGLLILLGAIPLWGWACVHNKALYH
jgi:hypothetical protein